MNRTPLNDTLYAELYDQMFRVAYRRVRNRIDALDVVQESWVKILCSLDTLKDQTKLRHWANVIAANTAINFVKRKIVRNSCAFDDVISDRLSADIGDMALKLEMAEVMERLDQLTRTMFLSKYVYGYKDDEIALAMRIPVGTVKARIHRGKARLRGIFNEELYKKAQPFK